MIIKKLKNYINYLLFCIRVRPSKQHWTIISYGSSGNVYLTCSILKAFKEKYKKKIHLVIPPQMQNITEMFKESIDKVIPYKSSWKPINPYLQSQSSSNKNIIYAHPDGNFDHNIFRYLMGYKNLSLIDICKLTLNLHPEVEEEDPIITTEANKKIEQVFINENLNMNNTILIAPYAQTANLISENFWNELIIVLEKKGYQVIVNGPPNNQIKAKSLLIPWDMIIPFSEKCKYFISLRSGLCDILKISKTKKIVIYPNKEFHNLYSLNNCWNDKNYIDLIYNETIIDNILKEINE